MVRKMVLCPPQMADPAAKIADDHATILSKNIAELTSRLRQCGEEKPACDNCSRRSTPCTYASHQSASATSTGPFVDHNALASLDGLSSHSPSSFATSAASSPHLSSAIQDTTLSFDQYATVPAGPSFELFDLELWNHWTTTICFSFAEDDAGDIAWRQNITKIAFKHAFVAQLMLAASALHMSRHDETRKLECIARSNTLQSSAINGMMSIMASGTGKKPTELWVAACMLVFCSFGKGPQPGQYMVYSDEGEPEWLGLLQGVKSILEQHREAIFPDVRPTFNPDDNIDRRIDPNDIIPGLAVQFGALRKSIETLEAEDSSFSKYLKALEGLYECFAGVFEQCSPSAQELVDEAQSNKKLLSTIQVRGRPDVKLCSHLVFAYIYRCNEDYLASVQTRRPMALVILAHFCVLLALLKDIWYMEGWVDHIMSAVERDLHPSHRNWLEWPRQHLDHVFMESPHPD